MNMVVELKKCNGCGLVKSHNDFNIKIDRKYGSRLNFICKACQSNRARERYEKIKLTPTVQVDKKICKKCKQEKDANNFTKRTGSRDGLSNSCKKCQSDYYYNNRVRISKSNKKSQEKRKTIVNAKKKEWAKRNADKVKKSNRAYYLKNKERIKNYQREWDLNNPIAKRNRVQRRNVKKKNQTVICFTLHELEQRLSVFDFQCYYCGGPFEHIDHLKPISKGGLHCLSNLRASCKSCNLQKAAMNPFKWLKIIGKIKE
jgi:hypothetical protein